MTKDMLLTLAIILLWALWAFFGKIASNKIGMQAPFWVFAVSFLIMNAYLFLSGNLLPLSMNASGILFAVLSGAAITVGSILYYILLKDRPVGLLITLTSLYPLVTIILSVLFLKETLTLTKIVGFIFAIVAFFLLSL